MASLPPECAQVKHMKVCVDYVHIFANGCTHLNVYCYVCVDVVYVYVCVCYVVCMFHLHSGPW